jgi:hypothetical protein
MAWIESHQELSSHPKMLQLAIAMEWDEDVTIGKLHRLWWWCLSYAPDGDLSKFNDAQIALAMRVGIAESSKLKKALVDACWLDRSPYFRVHGWWEYVGRFLRIKWKDYPKRWEAVRELYATGRSPPNIPETDPPKDPVKDPANRPTDQPNQPTAAAGARAREIQRTMPEPIDSPKFRQAWARWIDYLMDRLGKMPSLDTLDSHVQLLAKLGSVAAAVAAIENAVSKSLREPAPPFAGKETRAPEIVKVH